jgi:hypothetical protein
MLANDYVVVLSSYRTNSGTQNISVLDDTGNTGGQTWVEGTSLNGGTTNTVSRIHHCRFNGTWDANPAFGHNTGGTNPLSGKMLVFRGVNTTTAIDVAIAQVANAAPGTPFDVSIAEITTVTDGAMVVAFWTTDDDNSWTIQTSGFTASTPAQTRNLSGSDSSIAAAWKIFASAGPTGAVVSRQHTVTDDDTNTHILALRPAPATGVRYRAVTMVG